MGGRRPAPAPPEISRQTGRRFPIPAMGCKYLAKRAERKGQRANVVASPIAHREAHFARDFRAAIHKIYGYDLCHVFHDRYSRAWELGIRGPIDQEKARDLLLARQD